MPQKSSRKNLWHLRVLHIKISKKILTINLWLTNKKWKKQNAYHLPEKKRHKLLKIFIIALIFYRETIYRWRFSSMDTNRALQVSQNSWIVDKNHKSLKIENQTLFKKELHLGALSQGRRLKLQLKQFISELVTSFNDTIIVFIIVFIVFHNSWKDLTYLHWVWQVPN